ncbi:monovalent cation/H(+) antiporter subunit G [Streptomyces sp. NPDC002845]
MSVLDILSGVLLAAGALAVLSGGVGLLRFPDFYTRIHAAGITDSAGAGLILLGLLLRVDAWSTAVRLLIILLFLWLTSPTATHILAHAARRDGVPMWQEGDRRQ